MDELLSRGAGCAWRARELCRPVRSDSGDVARRRRSEWSRRSEPQASGGISRIQWQLVALPPELLRLREQAMRGQSASLTWQVFVAPAVPVWTKDDVPPGSERRMFLPVSATLITGQRDAVLVDTLMTVDQTRALGDWIAATGKNLTTICSRTATATTSSGSAVARLEGQ